MSDPAGKRLRDAIESERPLQVVGTINAYSALLAKQAGFRAIYLSGAGVANASFALPRPALSPRRESTNAPPPSGASCSRSRRRGVRIAVSPPPRA